MRNETKKKSNLKYPIWITLRATEEDKEILNNLTKQFKFKSNSAVIRYLIKNNKLETNQKEQNKELFL
jgi:Arc/MetJ-type ribon-helix-helix transcriptional regulator